MAHPVYVDGAAPAKSNARIYTAIQVQLVSHVRTTDYGGTFILFCRQTNKWYRRDSSDTTSVDDFGVSCIVGPNGERWLFQGSTGDVVGPASANDNRIVRFNSSSGKNIQNSVVSLSDTGAMTNLASAAFHDQSTTTTSPVVKASGNNLDIETNGSLTARYFANAYVQGHTAQIGTTFSGTVGSGTSPAWQLHGADEGASSWMVGRWQNGAGGVNIGGIRSRGAIGTFTALQNGDQIVNFAGMAVNGTSTDVSLAGIMRIEVDGTPGTHVPGRFRWQLQNGSGSLNEYLRISSTGSLFLNANTIRLAPVTGSPEGSLTASVASLAFRTSGAGATTTLYVKESGSGNTGWFGVLTTNSGYYAGGTDVAVADGGTGGSTKAAAHTNLNIVTTVNLVSMQTGNLTLTDQIAGESLLLASARYAQLVDLQDKTQVRFTVLKLGTAANTGAKMRLKYATSNPTSGASYSDIAASAGGTDLAIDTTNTMLDSGWVNLAAGAKADNIYVAPFAQGGDGAIDPQFGGITAYFR